MIFSKNLKRKNRHEFVRGCHEPKHEAGSKTASEHTDGRQKTAR